MNNQKFEETSENSPIKEIDIEKLYLKKYNSFLNKNDEPLHFLSFKEGVTEAIKILKKIK